MNPDARAVPLLFKYACHHCLPRLARALPLPPLRCVYLKPIARSRMPWDSEAVHRLCYLEASLDTSWLRILAFSPFSLRVFAAELDRNDGSVCEELGFQSSADNR